MSEGESGRFIWATAETLGLELNNANVERENGSPAGDGKPGGLI